jgi:YVTN family beta-propeller protein
MSSSVLIHPPRARWRRRVTALTAACALGLTGVLAASGPAAADSTPVLVTSVAVGGHPAGVALVGNATAYVANQMTSNVSVINTATDAVTSTIAVGAHPYGVAASPNGAQVYVADYGNGSGSTISEITTATGAVTSIPLGADPYFPVVSPDGTRLYVADNSGGVSVVNTATNAVLTTISTGSATNDLAVSPNGALIYAVLTGANSISVISTSTDTVTGTIAVGSGPDAVAFNPAGTQAYVTNNVSNTLSVINTATSAVTSTISVPGGPVGVAVSPDGAHVYTADFSGNNVTVIGTAADTVSETVAAGTNPQFIAASPDGTRLYVTNYSSNNVTVLGITPTPTLTGISPASGPPTGGTTVTITGTNLAATSSVSFGSTAATGVSCTATSCTATSPAESAGTVNVQVTTPGGTSATSSADQFTYAAAPTITSVSPPSGPPAGGNQVTINGTNLTGATLAFGTTAPTGVSCSATSCTATVPAAGGGTVDITATTPGGTSAINNNDHYTYSATPTITAVSPNGGPVGGGNTVTITGTNLAAVSYVAFGSLYGPSGSNLSCTATTCTFTAPNIPSATTSVFLAVVTASTYSAGNAASDYTYEAAPTITAISPASGPLAGGNTVTITGTGLAGTSTVAFQSGHDATNISCTATTCTLTAPSGTTGTTTLQLTTPAGHVTSSSSVTYGYQPPPTITSVVSNNGPLAGGTTVTITGTNLTGGYAVYFGPNWATSGFCTATYCNITVPAGNAGIVNIYVYTPGGVSAQTGADQFDYEGTPTVTSVSPSSGPRAGGNTVTITGTNLAGDGSISFGSGNYVKSGSCTATSCTVTVPAGTAGTVDVQVATASGTSATSSADHYTYT